MYALKPDTGKARVSMWRALRGLLPLLDGERAILVYATGATLCNAMVSLTAPLLIAHIVDTYIIEGQYNGMLRYSMLLLLLYATALFTSYGQTRLMGGVGQRVLYQLRARIFTKLQNLPVAFFNANKTGDLISRINNDTDKLNQFFSHTLVQFMGSIVIMTGAAIFLLAIHPAMGVAALVPAALLLLFTRLVSPWVKRKNSDAMAATGALSAEVSESLHNFRVIVAFNRRDFFRERFAIANKDNYRKSILAGIGNILFTPVFGLSSNLAQLAVLTYGLHQIATGNLSMGILLSYLAYVNNFYHPLRQLAALWANLQVALAGWDRIAAILQMESDMPQMTAAPAPEAQDILLEFRQASFHYVEGKDILHNLNLQLARGRTYALVGPTGGGKTTTASLMARLYDPSSGKVLFDGRDIRSVSVEERARRIGFILQEPVLFAGTVRDNILYGNASLAQLEDQALLDMLDKEGLNELLARFPGGLSTPVSTSGEGLSLGQKQLIAFMRAVLRHPDLLILDEATANIDTVTEKQLDAILARLPAHTTLVIIAHRLNTIANADEILFVNGTEITHARSTEEAVDMLLHGSHTS
jgi:ATP-binding cassette subfamily B protein